MTNCLHSICCDFYFISYVERIAAACWLNTKTYVITGHMILSKLERIQEW